MAASQNDNFLQAAPNWVGAIGAGGVSDGVVTTVPLVSSTSLPTTTGIQLTIDRVDANGNATPSKMEVVMGVVSGTNLISCLRGVEGTAQAHSAGAVVEYMLTADMWNQQANTLLIGHNQDGTHILDTDGTLAANSDTHIASQKAVKTYADSGTQTMTNKTLTKPTINASVPGVQTYSPAGGATATIDLSLANRNLIVMPAGNATIALSNATTGQIFTSVKLRV